MQFKKTILSAAVATTVGVAAGFSATAQADTITGTWSGVFTMLDANGGFISNTDTNPCLGGLAGCTRTGPVTGTLAFDTATGSGSGTVAAFSFFGGGKASATSISFQAIGNGAGGPGTLVLGNMGFNWNGNNGIPVSIVLDAAGFFGAAFAGLTVSQTITGGATPASANLDGTFPVGAVMATTTWNTTNIFGSNTTLGNNPSGTLPLIADTKSVGGSPMRAGPFLGSNANFDIRSIHVTSCTDTGTGTDACKVAPVVPVPAAVWLFGSGLLGLVGIARRRMVK